MLGDRIKEVRVDNKLNQIEFGKILNLSQSAVANYENGVRIPIDAIIKSICREFNINETWLKTGKGNKYAFSEEDQLMEWAGRVLASESDDFRKRFVKMLMGLNNNEWKLLEQKVLELAAQYDDDSQSNEKED